MKLPLLFSFFLSSFHFTVAFGQAPIYFENPSFEGEPSDATVPVGWLPCAEGTTPDILPGFWGVYREASEGDTYVGLITRSDGSWESITQRLSKPLKVKECYHFTVDLARSATYNQYNLPIKLRVWGSGSKCEKKQLLLETGFIEHASWKTYEINFQTRSTIHYIIFEAFYQDRPANHPGNILLDNLSPVKPCPRA